MKNKTLHADQLCFKHHDKRSNLIWNNFKFSVSLGETVSIIGSSGIGKTTLLRVLSGLHKFESGNIYIDSSENTVTQPKSPIFIVFQDYNLTLLPWLTVKENIKLADFKSTVQNKITILETLEILFGNNANNTKILEMYPDQLSGGQKQRIQIARALFSNSDFIFFDEPDTGVDIKTKLSLRKTFIDLAKNQNKGIVLITHDLDNAYAISDKLYIIHESNQNSTNRIFNLVEVVKDNSMQFDNFRKMVIDYL